MEIGNQLDVKISVIKFIARFSNFLDTDILHTGQILLNCTQGFTMPGVLF